MPQSAPEGWSAAEDGLHRTLTFKDFSEALAYVVEAGRLAENANHHPDIDIRWNKVMLTLMTHSAGRVTEKDHDLARQLNGITEAMVQERRRALVA